MKTLIAKEVRGLIVPTVAALFVYAALSIVVTLYAGPNAYYQTAVARALLMPLIAVLLGSWALSGGATQTATEWETAWPVSRGQLWATKTVCNAVALALIQMPSVTVAAGMMYLSMHAPMQMALRSAASSWHVVNWPQLSFVFMAFAIGLMFSGIMRKSVGAFLAATLSVGFLSFLYLLVVGTVLPKAFGPKLGVSLGYVGTHAALGCTALMAACVLWASLRGHLASAPLSYGARWRVTLRWAGWLALAAVPFCFGFILWAAAPHAADIRSIAAPTVSPDGKHVAFLGGRNAGFPSSGAGLWIMPPDASGMRCVARGNVLRAQWLPDNRRLLIDWMGTSLFPTTGRGRPRPPVQTTWIVDSETGAMDRLPGAKAEGDLMYSPDGQWALSGSNLQQLTPPYTVRRLDLPEGKPILGWSPDGKQLYVSEGPAGSPGNFPAGSLLGRLNETVVAVDLATGAKTGPLARAPRIVLPTPTHSSFDAHGFPVTYLMSVFAVSAPEQSRWWVWGDWIERRTATSVSTSYSGGGRHIVLVDRATRRQVRLSGKPLRKGFSPDGRYVWLQTEEGGFPDRTAKVTVVDLNTSQVTATLSGADLGETMGSADSIDLQWSPDGQRVASGTVNRDFGGQGGLNGGSAFRVWSGNADGSSYRVLFTLEEKLGRAMSRPESCSLAGWSADGKLIMSDKGSTLLSLDPATGQQAEMLKLKSSPQRRLF